MLLLYLKLGMNLWSLATALLWYLRGDEGGTRKRIWIEIHSFEPLNHDVNINLGYIHMHLHSLITSPLDPVSWGSLCEGQQRASSVCSLISDFQETKLLSWHMSNPDPDPIFHIPLFISPWRPSLSHFNGETILQLCSGHY
jgi:hypothetical protein